MQTSIQSFQELQVYQLAFRCSVEVYELAQAFPENPDSYLTRRLLATSRAVRAHIARAWGKRRVGIAWPEANRLALINQLSLAQLEAAEMQTWIEAAVAVGYLDGAAGQDLYDHYRCIFAALDQLMENALAGEKPVEEREDDLPATA